MTEHSSSPLIYSSFEKAMRLFADVRPKEGMTCLILISNIFLILTAYYLIKPVREGWLAISDIKGFTKLEVKAYSAFAQSLVLVAILPGYAWLAAVLPRRRLILTVGSVFGALLVVFWFAQPGMPLAVSRSLPSFSTCLSAYSA